MHEKIIYKGEWVLLDAYYYKFWILRTEFDKYKMAPNPIST